MAKSQMLPAVLQALILFSFSTIIWHNISTKVFKNVEEHEGVKNWTNYMALAQAIEGNLSNTVLYTGVDNSTNATQLHFNITGFPTNGTNGTNSTDENSFYTQTLPRELIFAAILFPLQYMFQMWLERTFPGRPRPTVPPTAGSEKMTEDSDAQEDELIKRLIVQGKIRRSSLSWWNTFVKFFLDMTLGQIWKDHLAYTLLEAAWKRHAFKKIWKDLKWGFLFKPWGRLFSLRPLASFLSYIIVPAHKRIVFVEGADLLWSVFLGIVLSIFVPWVMETEFAQMVIGNMTADAQKNIAAHAESIASTAKATATALPAIDLPEARLGDEL